MITVTILINGQPILTRSAVRIEGVPGGDCVYRVDDGNTIRHAYADGAVALAHKLLDTIIEPERERNGWVSMRVEECVLVTPPEP